jgi:transposase
MCLVEACPDLGSALQPLGEDDRYPRREATARTLVIGNQRHDKRCRFARIYRIRVDRDPRIVFLIDVEANLPFRQRTVTVDVTRKPKGA